VINLLHACELIARCDFKTLFVEELDRKRSRRRQEILKVDVDH